MTRTPTCPARRNRSDMPRVLSVQNAVRDRVHVTWQAVRLAHGAQVVWRGS